MPNPTRFVPPAYLGPDRDLSRLSMAARMLRSQIEGWPKQVFEEDVWRFTGPGGAFFVMNPEAVQTVLLDEADAFSTGALFRRVMRPAWGRGMLLAEGDDWRRQRRAAAGAFRPTDMTNLAPFFAGAARRALARWSCVAGQPIDMLAEMTRLTLEVILDATLSGAEDFDRTEMTQLIDRLFRRVNRLPLTWLAFPDRWHDGRSSLSSPERVKLLGMIGAMIARRRGAAPRGDLIDLMLQAHDPETGEGFDDDLMADNLLGFILAGHETTTLALTWSLYLVASHPPTMLRLRAEVATVLGEDAIGPSHIGQLQFTRQVVCEALRLYPPAYLLTRVAMRDVSIGGHRVRPGDRVNLPVYAIHRRAAHFADPHAFDPDRFAPVGDRHSRYAYLPFGAGPRVCLGANFAMAEAVVVLATLVPSAQFEVPSEHQVWPIAQLSLRPKGGMPLHVTLERPA